MKVLVTGGRKYYDNGALYRCLSVLHETHRLTLIIQGGATGADHMARMWAEANDVPCRQVDADWDKYQEAAGPIRNGKMLDLEPDLVVACPGGNGTANCVKQARKRGFDVYELGITDQKGDAQ